MQPEILGPFQSPLLLITVPLSFLLPLRAADTAGASKWEAPVLAVCFADVLQSFPHPVPAPGTLLAEQQPLSTGNQVLGATVK